MSAALAAGHLRKMRIELAVPARYEMVLAAPGRGGADDWTVLALEPLLGRRLRLVHGGAIHCVYCGARTRRSFSQGHCYRCSQRLARCDLCVLSPTRCHYHEGSCREPRWGEQQCMTEHRVYLANTSGLKVGLTRLNQVPLRWLDQGAVQALPIAATSTRQVAGFVEQLLAAADGISGHTDWRRMLGTPPPLSLSGQRERLWAECAAGLVTLRQRFGEDSIRLLEEVPLELCYPHSESAPLKQLNFDKSSTVAGCLLGIKGQYLMFDCGVLNIRRFAGYQVALSCDD